MKPFCANEKCFMNADEVPDDVVRRDVRWPDGSIKTVGRGWLVMKRTGHRWPLCSSCAVMIEVVRNDAGNLKRSFGVSGIEAMAPSTSSQILPFCANPECFAHLLEVPLSHQHADVGFPNGSVRRFTREWILSEKQMKRFPVCDTCGNVVAVLRGDGEGLPADTGVDIAGQLVDPDGRVIQTSEPEPAPADITEPEIIH